MPEKSERYQKNTFKEKQSGQTFDDTEGKDIGWSSVKDFFTDKRFVKVWGLFFTLLAVFLLLAFVAYLFSWKADDTMLDGRTLNWALLTDTSMEVQNMMGRLGAIAAHLFIKQSMGIGAFLLVIILFSLGIHMLFSTRLFSLKKTIGYSLFFMIWLSIFFGFVLPEGELLILGGIFGYEGALWLNGLLGAAGTALLLLFSMGCFIIIAYDPNFQALGKFFARPFTGKPATAQAEGEDMEHTDKWPDDADGTGTASSDESASSEKHDQQEDSDHHPADHTPDDQTEKEGNKPLELDTETAGKEETKTDGDPEWEFEVADGKVTGSDYQTIEDPYHKDGTEEAQDSRRQEYDPTLDLPRYKKPGLDLLDNHGSGTIQINKEELEENKNKIIDTLKNYSIDIDKIKATVGPTVTLYEIVPAPGIRISKIKNLENDIALSLSALGIRIIAPIPGKGTIGIEVPNSNPEIVSMKSVLSSDRFQHSSYDLPIGLGKTIANETFIADLTKMPHLLMAGATGQGKSVGLNAIMTSILYKKHPAYVKFVLVDPKKVELNLFSKIERHFLAKLPDAEEAIVTETKQVIRTINSLCVEMDNRYDLLKDAQARNIKEYNAKFISRRLNPNLGHRFLPYIILFVDEFADLIMTAGKEMELPIARLAQLARAVGIHLIIATQRPSVNIITGTIKANFPARIAFRVTSRVDSRTILDTGGADQLIGRGDMLLSTGSDLLRLQCAFIDAPEIEQITEYIGAQKAYPDAFHLPEYLEDEAAPSDNGDPAERDDLFEEAARVVVATQQGSTSLIQRKLKLGYNRAGRIIDQLEAAGIVGPFEGSKAREVRIKDEMSLEQILKHKD